MSGSRRDEPPGRIIRQGRISEVTDTEAHSRAVVEYLGAQTEVVLLQPYGFSANPPVGSLGTIFQSNGDQGTKYAMVNDPLNRFRNLAPGEVKVGNYGHASSIYFNDQQQIVIETGSSTVTINENGSMVIDSPEGITINGGNVTVVGGDVIADGISLKTHVHPITSGSSAPGPTGAPQ